jgi:hypothetical protein
MTALSRLQSEVTFSAQRLDAALLEVGDEARDVRRIARALPPKLLLGVAAAAGFLLVVLPKHLRGSTLIGLGKFALTHILPLLAGSDDE